MALSAALLLWGGVRGGMCRSNTNSSRDRQPRTDDAQRSFQNLKNSGAEPKTASEAEAELARCLRAAEARAGAAERRLDGARAAFGRREAARLRQNAMLLEELQAAVVQAAAVAGRGRHGGGGGAGGG